MKMPPKDQMIAEEISKGQASQSPKNNFGLETDIYNKLAAEFPTEAMSADKSRGFTLTSIKAQYVVERLNTVFGFMNWSHGGEYKETPEGVMYMGTLVVSVGEKTARQFSVGFSKVTEGKNLGDAYKAAKTDSLSKAASLMGVGNSVFKGLVSPDGLVKTTVGAATPMTARAKKTAEAMSDTEESSNVTPIEKKPAPFNTRTKIRKTAAAGDDI